MTVIATQPPTTTAADGQSPPTNAAIKKSAPATSNKPNVRRILLLIVAIAGCIAGYFIWKSLQPKKLPEGFVSSNGRIEATEVDVATKLAGRIVDELVDEGDYVTAGQIVGNMDTATLEAELREAKARLAILESVVNTAQSTVVQRESEKAAAEAVAKERAADADLAQKNLARAEQIVKQNERAISKQDVDTYRSNWYSAIAAVSSAKANVAACDAAISTAKTLVVAAQSAVDGSKATIQRVEADLKDSALKAPRDGRVQYRVSQPGEVLNSGGKVINIVDLKDVYITFFLPTEWAGRTKLGTDVHIVLDAAPQFVIPAKVTFVADVAQFTPKTVETAEERQKLTFRVKAHIDQEVLKKHIRDVKTGLPGVAYVQLDPQAPWPANLEVRLPQ